jgi:hypothetical protein
MSYSASNSPVTAHAIFSQLDSSEVHSIFESLHQDQKPAYKSAMQATAARRKLRPAFLEKKPRVERHRWMQGVLSQRANEDVAMEILQTWLLSVHRPMICRFLDKCGIEHADGLMDDIPPQPPADRLHSAVDDLFESGAELPARVYLRVFQPVDDQAWPELDALLASDPRLKTADAP